MKFHAHAALVTHTNRLAAASAAATACDASMKDENQIFDYAGQRFVGPDAGLLKHVLLTALLGIADDATNALKKGGIDFGEIETDDKARGANRSQRRAAKSTKKKGR